MKVIDLTGQKFGRLTVLKPAGNAPNGNLAWACRCDCGNACVVDGYGLRSGATKSCGCLQRETSARLAKENPVFQSHMGDSSSLVTKDGIYVTSIIKGSRNKSGVVGVSFDKTSGKWNSRLRFHGHYVLLKTFDNFQEAVDARKEAEQKYFKQCDNSCDNSATKKSIS